MKSLSIIVAATPQGEIGANNTIPWKLKGDLARFKEMTKGNIVIMGRKTYESLPGTLPDRNTIVVTRRPSVFMLPRLMEEEANLYAANSLTEAIKMADSISGNQIFIAGGASLYEEAIGELYPCTFELTTVYKESFHDYDTIIKNFSLKGFEYNPEKTEVVYDKDPNTGLYIVSHTYSQYTRS